MKKLLAVAVVVVLLVIGTASAFTPTIQVQSTAIGMGEFNENIFANMGNKTMLGETYMKPLTVNYVNTSKTIVASANSVGIQGYNIFQTAKTKYCIRNYDIGAGVGFAAFNTTQSEFVIVTEQASAGIQLQSLANGGIKAWAIEKDPTNHTELFRVVQQVKGSNVQLNFTAQINVPDFVAGEEEGDDWLKCP